MTKKRSPAISDDIKRRTRSRIVQYLAAFYDDEEIQRKVRDEFAREGMKVTLAGIQKQIDDVVTEAGGKTKAELRNVSGGMQAWRKQMHMFAVNFMIRLAMNRTTTKKDRDGNVATVPNPDLHAVVKLMDHDAKLFGLYAKQEAKVEIVGMEAFMGPRAPIKMDQMSDDDLYRFRDLCGVLKAAQAVAPKESN